MKITVLDIETVPSPDYAGAEDEFPALHYHRPVAICWLTSSPFKVVAHYGEPDGEWEKPVLQQLGKEIAGSTRLVTFNGRGFDMPLLNLRAMRHRVDWSFWPGKRHRYENYKKALFHFDMQEMIGDQGAARNFGLDGTAKLLGLPGKTGMHGGEVKAAYEAGKLEEVAWYCTGDVLLTYLLYLRYVECFEDAPAGAVEKTWAEVMGWAKGHAELGW